MTFFVQESPKAEWHAESDDDCERMLCGARVSVDAPLSKVQSKFGPRRCFGCWAELERRRRIAAALSR